MGRNEVMGKYSWNIYWSVWNADKAVNILWTSCESLSDSSCTGACAYSVEENQRRDNGDWRVDNGRQTKNERWTYRNSAGRAYYISSAQHCGGVTVYEHIKQSCRRRVRFTTRPSDSGTVLTGHGKSVRVSDWTRLGAWWSDTDMYKSKGD